MIMVESGEGQVQQLKTLRQALINGEVDDWVRNPELESTST